MVAMLIYFARGVLRTFRGWAYSRYADSFRTWDLGNFFWLGPGTKTLISAHRRLFLTKRRYAYRTRTLSTVLSRFEPSSWLLPAKNRPRGKA